MQSMPSANWRGAIVLAAMTSTACVPQGKYDKLAQDAQHLQAELRASQGLVQADDAELGKLRSGNADAAARDRDKRLADALASSGDLRAKLDAQPLAPWRFHYFCAGP
jgi:outer membrane murein-binding lipoprotein Lpp